MVINAFEKNPDNLDPVSN